MIRVFFLFFVLGTVSQAYANSIPMLEFKQVNAAAGDAQYRMGDHPNNVFVFEAYRVSCGSCGRNAEAVARLAREFTGHTRVQILDLSLDLLRGEHEQWIHAHEPRHPVVVDQGLQVFRALRSSSSVPQAFVVNCRGELVGNLIGEWDVGAEAKVRRLIDVALETDCN